MAIASKKVPMMAPAYLPGLSTTAPWNKYSGQVPPPCPPGCAWRGCDCGGGVCVNVCPDCTQNQSCVDSPPNKRYTPYPPTTTQTPPTNAQTHILDEGEPGIHDPPPARHAEAIALPHVHPVPQVHPWGHVVVHPWHVGVHFLQGGGGGWWLLPPGSCVCLLLLGVRGGLKWIEWDGRVRTLVVGHMTHGCPRPSSMKGAPRSPPVCLPPTHRPSHTEQAAGSSCSPHRARARAARPIIGPAWCGVPQLRESAP